MFQVAPRVWPADAVHDTVAAVVRGPAFRRSLPSSLAERLMAWLGEWFERIFHLVGGRASSRVVALAFVATLVVLVVARLVLSARARDVEAVTSTRGRRHRALDDPWREADRLMAERRFDEAAHALYRGVLASIAQREQLRLDPSKTSGDYARELRRRASPALPAFRAFARRFDRAVYGRGGCDATSLGALRELAEPFAPRARAA